MKNIIVIICLLFGKQNLFSQNNKVSVSIDSQQLMINNQLVFRDDGFFFNIDSFTKIFKEKPQKHKNKTAGLYDYWYNGQGSCVSQIKISNAKKKRPTQIIFNFASVPEGISYYSPSVFTGDFFIHGVKIDANTTKSDLQFLKQYYPASDVEWMQFDKFYFQFESKLKNPKITSITYKL